MDTAFWSLESLAGFVLLASLKGTLLIAAVLLVQTLCAGCLSARGRYLLWLPVVLGLVTPLGFETAVPLRPLATAIAPPQELTTALLLQEQPAFAAAPEPAAATSNSPATVVTASAAALPLAAADTATDLLWPGALLRALPWLWLAGVLGVLALLLLAQRRLDALLQRSMPASAALQQLLADCRQQTGCRTTVSVRHSGDVEVPMITGLWRPVLLLPGALQQQLTESQLRHVFVHELTHLKRGDILINWCVALVQALHWFNPVVWFAFHCLRQDRELACDSATLQQLAPAERASYGHTLLQLNDVVSARPVPAVALGILQSSSHLHRRIHMLVQQPRYQRLQSVFCGLLLLPLAAVAFSQPGAAQRVADDTAAARPKAAAAALGATAPAADLPEAGISEAATATGMTSADSSTQVAAAAPRAEPRAQATAVGNPEPAAARLLAQADTVPATTAVPATATPAAPASAASAAPEQEAATAASAAPSEAEAQVEVEASAALTPTPAPSPQPYAGLAAIQQLTADLRQLEADSMVFVSRWDDIGKACATRKDSFFGVLAASCQRIRTALRNGDILDFSYQCFLLNSIHTQQLQDYRATLQQQPELPEVAAALQANEGALATFCSRETWNAQYPAFAGIVAEAEQRGYTPPPIQMSSSRFNPPWNGGQRWVDTVNSTSMISHVPAYAAPEPSTYYSGPFSPSNPAGGDGMGGGSTGGDGGGAAPAPAPAP